MNKMAEVVGFFENGTAKIQFDGEDIPSEKEYGFLRHYIPKIGDRVFMMEFNGSYIIFDAVDYQVSAQKPINLNYIKGDAVIEGNLTLKGGPKTVESVNGIFKNIIVDKISCENLDKKSKEHEELIKENKSKLEQAQSTANNAQSAASRAQTAASNAAGQISGINMKINNMQNQISNLQSQVNVLRMKIR